MQFNNSEQYNHIVKAFANKEAIVFCGAGVSLEPPAGLPDWHNLRDYTLAAITKKDPLLERYLPLLTEIEMMAIPGKKGLTPEYVASIINQYCAGYFESFRVLEQGEPNANHQYLAKIAKQKHLSYIFTTNFDVFLEQAFQNENIPFKVYRTDEEYQHFVGEESLVHIFKLHGCIHSPETITATVEQEGQGLSEAKIQVIEKLLKQYIFVFWGYSGADLKLDIDYLRMKTLYQNAKGFIWNFLQQGTNLEPINSSVQQLANLYGNKATIVHGKLPHIFDVILAEEKLSHREYTKEEEIQLSQAKNQKLQASLVQWGEQHLTRVAAFAIIGHLLKHSGHVTEALECHQQLLKTTDDSTILAQSHNELGYIYKLQSQYDQAMEHFKKAYDIACCSDNQKLQALYSNSIGGIYRVWRQYDQALKHYLEAEKIARSINDQAGLAMYLNKIGGLNKSLGNWNDALRYLQEAEKITRAIGDKQGLAINLDNIGKIYRDQKKSGKALTYLQEAEKLTRALGDKQGLAIRLSSLGGLYKKQRGMLPKALKYYLEAEQIARSLGDQRGILLHSHNIASIYKKQREYQKAIRYYSNALEIADSLQDAKNAGKFSQSIAEIYHKDLKEFSNAIPMYKRSQAFYRQVNWRREASRVEEFIKTCQEQIRNQS